MPIILRLGLTADFIGEFPAKLCPPYAFCHLKLWRGRFADITEFPDFFAVLTPRRNMPRGFHHFGFVGLDDVMHHQQ
jgi:hypothetical protein